jgi:hypothetical protein
MLHIGAMTRIRSTAATVRHRVISLTHHSHRVHLSNPSVISMGDDPFVKLHLDMNAADPGENT